MNKLIRATVDAAKSGEVGRIGPGTCAYVTAGGTYMIASDGEWNDNGLPRDLVAVLPGALEGSRVVPLYVAVNPDLITALRAELDR